MYFKGENAIWDADDLDKRAGVKQFGYVQEKLEKVSKLSIDNEEVLLMWRGHINLKYLFVVNDVGQTVEPYQYFVKRVTELRRADPAFVKSCVKQVRDSDEYRYQVLRKKLTDKTRERGFGCLVDDSKEVSACA